MAEEGHVGTAERGGWIATTLLCVGLLIVVHAIHPAASAANERLLPDNLEESARCVAYQLPRRHVRRLPFDDVIASRALSLYLDSLDSEHCYFLAADIASFTKDERQLDNFVIDGDLVFGEKVYRVFLERVSNRVAYVESLLACGFDFGEEESYQLEHGDAPWPVSREAWNELWRKKIKREFLSKLMRGDLVLRAMQSSLARDTTKEDSARSDVHVIEQAIIQRYETFVVNVRDQSREWICQKYLDAFAKAYDPHSAYMSPSTVEDFEIERMLSQVGVGLLLKAEDGAAKIVRLIPGGPADKDGRLTPGDRIIAVAQGDDDPISILHWPLHKAVRVMRGKKGTKVVLTVVPAHSESSSKRVEITRDEVKLEQQRVKEDIRDIRGSDGATRHLAAIEVPAFYVDLSAKSKKNPNYTSVTRDVEDALRSVRDKNVEGILLDLRNNGGGALLEAITMTGLFIETGPVVQIKEASRVRILPDRNPKVAWSGPLVVLVNRLSASATEILAGALQDYGRAVIVGDSMTYGMGSVQSIFSLGEGVRLGTIKVTMAEFYRLSGESTQRKGITPDIVVPSHCDAVEIGERDLPGTLPWGSIRPATYQPVHRVKPFLPELLTLSVRRRSEDFRFVVHGAQLRRFASRIRSKSVSLRLRDRLRSAADEQEMDDLRNAKAADADALILEEALHILADLVELESRGESGGADQP